MNNGDPGRATDIDRTTEPGRTTGTDRVAEPGRITGTDRATDTGRIKNTGGVTDIAGATDTGGATNIGGRKKKKKRKGSAGRRILSIAGTTMIVLVVLLCCLLTLPKVFGYQMYHVLSGSMEPEIPVGSLIYVREGQAEEVQEGDVIAFYASLEDAGIITHRVVKNNVVSGTFRTKGDANEQEDPLPIPYENYIGTATLTVPYLGMVLMCMTSPYGKIGAVSLIVLGVVLNIIAAFMERKYEA